jgi:FtsP/CotA-like multicopper oxidase with cupredoxin domain
LTTGVLHSQTPEPVATNDNRTPAGELKNGVLTLRLEIREGIWRPHSEDGEAIPVFAFAEPGKPLQAPGPLVRVPAGTIIEASIHNRLKVPATLHGFHQRPGDNKDTVTVEQGSAVQVRFAAGVPGTYLYLARAYGDGPDFPRVDDTFLAGAFVVDQPGSTPDDRIFVLHRWNGPIRTAINGKSWPYTEQLTYQAGETVRWRIINASDLSHPMHLHGSHYFVEGFGDGERYQTYKGEDRPLVFTTLLEVNETMEMSWTPHMPGRWLYHCHRIPHMRFPVPLDPKEREEAEAADHHPDHAQGPDYGMGGMIVGITVVGKPGELHESAAGWKAEHRVQLHVRENKANPRFFNLEVRGPGQLQGKRGNSSGAVGPPLVLAQNEPAEIEVVNHLKEATSIHWHGMELESYYDGVPGFGGIGERKAPAVGPGETFGARMTPPRAGSFIYHTHWHDAYQLTGGVTGPLLVLPPGQNYDPETDKTFFFSSGEEQPFGGGNMVLLNGSPQPLEIPMKTRTKYRLRLFNMTNATANLRVSLRQGGVPVLWRLVAKDAVDLPASAVKMKRADQIVSVGETYDFEFEAAGPQTLTLEGTNPNDHRRVSQALVFSESSGD